MKTITVDDVMGWKPCYDEKTGAYGREYVEQLFAGRERMSALDVLDLDIPIQDRFWVVLGADFLTEEKLRLFAADCAERVLHNWERKYPDDLRPRQTIETARAFARGEATREQLAAAGVAGVAGAARSAVWSAVWAAGVAGAAWEAEQQWQLNRLREYLRGEA